MILTPTHSECSKNRKLLQLWQMEVKRLKCETMKTKQPVVERSNDKHYCAHMMDTHDDKIFLLHLKEDNLGERLHLMSKYFPSKANSEWKVNRKKILQSRPICNLEIEA
jgi:hypothetical protein